MAKINHVSVQTLRYYEKIDLLKPIYVNGETNYRYYDIKQSAILDMIQYMKSLGMPLKQIKVQFEKGDIAEIQNILKMQSRNIDKEIEKLNNMKKGVKAYIENYNRYLKLPAEGFIGIEHIPERKIFCYDGKINIYDHGLETYEYFCNVGSILRKEMIDISKFVSTEIFLFINADFKMQDGIEIIPANSFVCIYFNSFWKEQEYAKKLFDYVYEKGYEIIGDYICEVVVELPVFDNNERNMFAKLQIPIKI
jgi:DNA-binding transcriptional MerR regulator